MLKCGDCLNYSKCYVPSAEYKTLFMIEPACDRFQPKGVNYNGNSEQETCNQDNRNEEDGCKETRD